MARQSKRNGTLGQSVHSPVWRAVNLRHSLYLVVYSKNRPVRQKPSCSRARKFLAQNVGFRGFSPARNRCL